MEKDWDKRCAKRPHLIKLRKREAWFWDTQEEAFADLLRKESILDTTEPQVKEDKNTDVDELPRLEIRLDGDDIENKIRKDFWMYLQDCNPRPSLHSECPLELWRSFFSYTNWYYIDTTSVSPSIAMDYLSALSWIDYDRCDWWWDFAYLEYIEWDWVISEIDSPEYMEKLTPITIPQRFIAHHEEPKEVPLDKTNRGFYIYEFTDRYGRKCSLQESSMVWEECIWLWVHDTRMCITYEHMEVVIDKYKQMTKQSPDSQVSTISQEDKNLSLSTWLSKGEKLATFFHKTYERLAPIHNYNTRDDTKDFDLESNNWKLMVAVCEEVLNRQEKNKPIDSQVSLPSSETVGDTEVSPTSVKWKSDEERIWTCNCETEWVDCSMCSKQPENKELLPSLKEAESETESDKVDDWLREYRYNNERVHEHWVIRPELRERHEARLKQQIEKIVKSASGHVCPSDTHITKSHIRRALYKYLLPDSPHIS